MIAFDILCVHVMHGGRDIVYKRKIRECCVVAILDKEESWKRNGPILPYMLTDLISELSFTVFLRYRVRKKNQRMLCGGHIGNRRMLEMERTHPLLYGNIPT